MQGLFVSIEGGEGAGKSTLLSSLAERLMENGYEVVQTREPGGSKLGEFIRGWLLQHDSAVSIGDTAELLLFLAARSQHIEEKIQPALKQGKIVLCDRFNDSTIAYQGGARGLTKEAVKELCEKVCRETVPDMTFLLDIAPEEGLKRSARLAKEHAAEGELDRIESEAHSFHELVRKAFLELAKENPGRIHVLDARKPRELVLEEAWGYLLNKMKSLHQESGS